MRKHVKNIKEYHASRLAHGDMLGLLSIGFIPARRSLDASVYYYVVNYNCDNEIYISYTHDNDEVYPLEVSFNVQPWVPVKIIHNDLRFSIMQHIADLGYAPARAYLREYKISNLLSSAK